MTRVTDCAHCGAENALETTLKIDLDDVAFDSETNEVVSFILAGSANDPFNGLVVEEARVSCRECGKDVPSNPIVPLSFTNRWVYYDTNPMHEKAQLLVHLLNRSVDVFEALAQLGIEEEDVSPENPGLTLDDPDNDVIDLHANVYVQRHAGRWHVHTLASEADDDD